MSSNRFFGVSLVLGIVTLWTGCTTYGNGELASEERTVGRFTKVESNNGVTVLLTMDDSASGDVALTVSGDANLLDKITTSVSGDTLIVTTIGTLDAELPLEVEATIAALTEARAIDGAGVEAAGIRAETFFVEVDHGGHMFLSGTSSELDAIVDNGSDLQAEVLKTQTAQVTLDNGSAADVCVSVSADGEADNGSVLSIHCGGSATVDTSNGGRVKFE